MFSQGGRKTFCKKFFSLPCNPSLFSKNFGKKRMSYRDIGWLRSFDLGRSFLFCTDIAQTKKTKPSAKITHKLCPIHYFLKVFEKKGGWGEGKLFPKKFSFPPQKPHYFLANSLAMSKALRFTSNALAGTHAAIAPRRTASSKPRASSAIPMRATLDAFSLPASLAMLCTS